MPKSLLVRKLRARLQQVESELAEAHVELSHRQANHLRLLVRLRQAAQLAGNNVGEAKEPPSAKAVQPARRLLAVTATSTSGPDLWFGITSGSGSACGDNHRDNAFDHAVPPPRATTSPQSARRSRVLNRLHAADASTWRGSGANGTNGIDPHSGCCSAPPFGVASSSPPSPNIHSSRSVVWAASKASYPTDGGPHDSISDTASRFNRDCESNAQEFQRHRGNV